MRYALHTDQVDSRLAIIALSGDADMLGVPAFTKELQGQLARGRTALVVDLSATSFIDAAMLGALRAGQRALGEHGGQLALVSADQTLRRLLQITRLDGELPLFPSRAEAIAAIQSWSGPSG